MSDGIVIHAVKAVARIGRVKHLSVAFTEASIPLTEPYREELRKKLARLVHRHGKFEIVTKYPTDWHVIFDKTFPERELDVILSAIATRLGAMIFIEPGMPLSEIASSSENLRFTINPSKRLPNN